MTTHIQIKAEASVRDYFALLKPRVMTLVVFTGFVGLWLAPGHIHPVLGLVAILSLAIGAGAAGAINMWYDRDIDAVMIRTRLRPIPAGLVDPDEALTFALVLSTLSVLTMMLAVGTVAGGLLAFSIFFYGVVYTVMLKRFTPQNIVIGGAAGAFPPLIGWAAVTGDITLFPILLFLIIFFWTPPHFWALALISSDDYKRAGVPMMPVVKGSLYTRWQMLIYSLILIPISVAPSFLGFTGWGYGLAAFILSITFFCTAFRVLKDPSSKNCKLMFSYSIVYLFAIFIAFLMGG